MPWRELAAGQTQNIESAELFLVGSIIVWNQWLIVSVVCPIPLINGPV